MQIKNDPSNPYAQTNPALESVAQSELPAVVKTGSLIALIAVILGTLFGSLLASPDPAEIARQQEAEVTTTELPPEPESTAFESSTVEVTPPVTTSTTPTTDIASTPSTETTTDAPVTDTNSTETDDTEIDDSVTLNSGLTYSPSTETKPVAPIGGFPPESVETPTPTTPSTPPDATGVDPATTPETSTTTGSSLPDIEPTTPETTTSVDPSALTTTDPGAIAATTTSPDPAQLEQLNQTVYQTIDQAFFIDPLNP